LEELTLNGRIFFDEDDVSDDEEEEKYIITSICDDNE